jgi:hypothetical protein
MKHYIYLLLLLSLAACNKAENFKTQLDRLPQINNEPNNQYLPAYGIGDTLKITGLLYPKNDLHIKIGGIEAPVVRQEQVSYASGINAQIALLDRLSVIITREMGVGQGRPVTVISSGNTAQGADIEIYEPGGSGSFTKPLQLVSHYTPESRQNVYLHCINGKGTLFYYGFTDKGLYRLKKDGSRETLLTATQLQTDQSGNYSVTNLLAGGVNPQESKLWVSLQTTTDFRFCEIDLATRKVTTLNKSNAIQAPYEGNIGALNIIVTGVYPDSRGNVFLLIGTQATNPEFNAMAVARFSIADQSVKYLFKTRKGSADMPGSTFNSDLEYSGIYLRFYPEEATMYLFVNRSKTFAAQVDLVPGISVYNLNTTLRIADFAPTNFQGIYNRYLGPFSTILMRFSFAGNYQPQTGTNFGFMPLPGQRLQFMLYAQKKDINGQLLTDFPKWEVVDFNASRLYLHAPGKVSMNGFVFGPDLERGLTGNDELLNYDEDGHLYMTANQRTAIIKTAL